MSLAYQNSGSDDILQGGTQADYRNRLFDQYIKRLFERRGTTQRYSKQQTQGWLVWLACSLICGGWACFQHFNLRCVMYFQGYVPWHYAQFLDYCTDRLFLQKVGGGYIFVHRMLLEHFAAMSLEEGKR